LHTRSQQTYAAIDLGSNSFHMVLAEPEGTSIRIVDSLRTAVRLGAGLDKKKRLKPATEELALETLAIFAHRLRGVPHKQIRVVGTNTLRRAKNTDEFMRKAYAILGKQIEIIAGREEARLIYSAVAKTTPDIDLQRLVVDIGGGSTELVIGKGLIPSLMESVHLGCVSNNQTFFTDQPKITAPLFKKAITACELELQPISKAYREAGWDEAVGCSGTIKATSRLLAELGITDGSITNSGLKKLRDLIVEKGSISALKVDSISNDRQQVIAGGIAVLSAVFRTLSLKQMRASQIALREGLIFEMIGHAEHVDVQSQTISNLVRRYAIDLQQAARVDDLVLRLFPHVEEPWELEREQDLALLSWAARLHEIGMSVAHTQYHKHGAYIVENSDLLGFSLAEQRALSLLVRFHRRKIDLSAFDDLPREERHRLLKLLSLLRLSALLCRSRHADDYSAIKVRVKNDQLTVIAPQTWLDEHPLTAAELSDEADRLLHIDIRLKISKAA